MENKNVTINISTSTVLKTIGFVLLLMFLYLIGDIILLMFISIMFASLIEPPVNYLESKKVPRGLGVIFIYMILILFLVLIVRLLIPPIVEQVASLTGNFPELWSRIMENFSSLRQYSEQQGFVSNIQSGLLGLQNELQKAAGGVYSFVISLFANLINFVMVLVLTFYLVVQKDAVSKLFKAVAPAEYHDYLIGLFVDIQKKIGDWARAQLILGLIVGALSFVGLMFLLPKYALVLALVAGLTEMIPYLGPILGAIPAVFLGFTVPPISVTRGLFVLILYLVIQQLENNIIVPQVMKRHVGLNPVVVIIVMLIGARIAGIIGIVLAIPVATTVSVIAKDFLQKSELPKLKAELDNDSAQKNK
ncbi:MAG: AI-2E family transporter [Patescibacteria group bacterium]|nr:AI-2E family transporter [Patescibacteria group bacterium]